VAHEHAHALQLDARGLMTRSNKTLLEQSLLEGAADFVGERSSGGNIKTAALRDIIAIADAADFLARSGYVP
jgi:hypothetical protein